MMNQLFFEQKKGVKAILKRYPINLWSLFLFIYGISCITKLCYSLSKFKSAVDSDGINEYLVNYQSGFVRRGLAGEILYYIYQYTGCNVSVIIKLISVLAIILLSYLLIRMMHKKGLSSMLAFIPVSGISLYLFHFNYAGCRKDPILLLIIIACLYFLRKITQKFSNVYLILINVLVCIGLLLHEAFAFFSIPIIGSFLLSYFNKRHNLLYSILIVFIYLFPCIVTLLACSIYKGESWQSIQIWQSWNQYFREYDQIAYNTPIEATLAPSIKCIGWPISEAVSHHIDLNFFSTSWYIPSALYWPLILFCYFYLMVHPNVPSVISPFENSSFNKTTMLNIVLFVFISMILLFSVLSCDFSRSFVFLSITSIASYCIIPHELISNSIINYLTPVSKRIIKLYDCRILNNAMFLKIFVLVFAIPACTFDLTDALYSSIVGTPIGLLKEMIIMLWQ